MKMQPKEVVDRAKIFLEQFSSESDRGAALIALAYLDDLLEELIRKRMLNEKGHVDRLLEYPGPLATSNARADLAYALGWIGAQIHGDLSVIRKIRNNVAHTYEGFDFEKDNRTADLCKKLQAADFAGVKLWKSRDRFLMSAAFLGLQLDKLCRESETPSKVIDPPIVPIAREAVPVPDPKQQQ